MADWQEAEAVEALIIGAGPAGLMGAERLSARGFGVVLAEAMPSPGRKFLMAGKSGLNLTNAGSQAETMAAFGSAASKLEPMLEAFGPNEICAWAEGLGQPLFTGSTGRVFPQAMKASPLLRAWLGRLAAGGAVLRTRWRWVDLADGIFHFDTPDGRRSIRPSVAILALGGASWPRLGSDGSWAETLGRQGIPLSTFAPANAGLKVRWSDHMRPHFGAPLKNIRLSAGGLSSRGECVISARGLEGGGLYKLTPALREGAALVVDLFPDRETSYLAERLSRRRGKASRSAWLRKTLGLTGARMALVNEVLRPLPADADLPNRFKTLTVSHEGVAPLAEAISTAGGLGWDALDDDLGLHALTGVYAAGEMLDWEAPTGGYLLTGCLATGAHAGEAAARRLARGR